ncbi:MAG: TAXI family TRAP transporter solute-binding subunit [Kiloniellales bacterium]|nr:TAXI family TRAP transporter solute-binding subunit [Kiloniellales bacterium]
MKDGALKDRTQAVRQDPQAGQQRQDWRLHRRWRQLAAALGGVAIALGLAAGAILLPDAPGASAEDIRFFRIGTGSTSGTYFPIGGIIATAISSPPGSRACEVGGSCGVPGLIAVAQSTSGSVDNVDAIASGRVESGFSQADIAYWAYNGKGPYAKKGPVTSLRAISNLYPEAVHIVVRRDARLTSPRDLKGLRVSLDKEGSGTKVDAELILRAYGLTEKDIEPHYVPAGLSIDKLRAGELDAFFWIAGAPAKAVSALAEDTSITLLPIKGKEADSLIKKYPFFGSYTIQAGAYLNVPATETLSVGAQWLVGADVEEETVYEITRALWHENTASLLARGHPTGKLITQETALQGIGIPLHPGAERFYEELATATE